MKVTNKFAIRPGFPRILLLLGALLIYARMDQAAAWYEYPERYERWQTQRPLTMAAWHQSIPHDHLPERIARYKAAGLNTFFYVAPNQAAHFFRAAHEGGLEWQTGLRASPEIIEQTLAMPGCSALLVDDEPSMRNLSEEEQTALYAQLKDRIDWAHTHYPDMLAYINLSIMKIDLDRYVQTCRPDVFSFDMYPLHRGGFTHSNYLRLVNLGRHTAMKYHLPFWMVLQAWGRDHELEDYAYRIPDQADLRFLVFSLLAHGGTGMHFYHYYGEEALVDDFGVESTTETDPELQHYENSRPSRAWFALRDLAPEVRNLGRALLALRPKGEVAYAGCLPDEGKPLQNHALLRAVDPGSAPDAQALIGFFDDQKGAEYSMVVNLRHGPNLSKVDAAATLRLVFTKSVEKIERLNRFTGQIEELRTEPGENETQVLDLWLEGGTGDLFRWPAGHPWPVLVGD